MIRMYILSTPAEDNGLYTVLAIDNDRQKRNDSLYTCTRESILSAIKDVDSRFMNLQFNDGTLCTTYSVKQTDELHPLMNIRLHSGITLCDLWSILISVGAKILVGDQFVPAYKISFSMSSNVISYTSEAGKTTILWKLPSIADLSKQVIKINASLEVCDWLYSELPSTIRENETTCLINLSVVKTLNDFEISLLRYHFEELQQIASEYQLLRAYTHGVECGAWYTRYLAGIERPLYTHRKPTFAECNTGVKFKFNTLFPDATVCAKNLAKDHLVGKSLFKVQSNMDFYSELLPYTNCSTMSKYYICFADGMQSQMSDQQILKDHELLQLEEMQQRLTLLACKLFEYRMSLEFVPIDIPTTVHLTDGTLDIIKEITG